MTRQPMTLVEHRELGSALLMIRGTLMRAGADLSDRYGVASRAGRASERALRAVDGLRAAMDEQFVRDFPAAFDATVYFPAGRTAVREL
jgi:hypothetical protein